MESSQLNALLAKKLKEYDGMSNEKCEQIAFHMTDWVEDLRLWYSTLESLESRSGDEIMKSLTRFLIHAPDHIEKAAKILTD